MDDEITIDNVDDRELGWVSKGIMNYLRGTIRQDAPMVIAHVESIRMRYPELTADELAKKVIGKAALRTGLFGGITGLGGLPVMMVAVPSDLYFTVRLQARMAMTVAYVYGYDITGEEIADDTLLILLGGSVQEVVRVAGIAVAKDVTKRSIQKHVTRDVMKRVGKVVSRKLLTKAGEKSATSFMKLVPLVGGPVGFAVNYGSTRMMGLAAIRFYGDLPQALENSVPLEGESPGGSSLAANED
ncbi:MAG: EcsC family protein [Deltaproteobacteria bacterium]|nr:EcsC family protein [Deltaproteobacteria bacterium]